MNKSEIIDKLLSEIENARLRFMRGEINAIQYCSIRSWNLNIIKHLIDKEDGKETL